MSGEVKKIDLIKNMAVFHDFRWASSVKDDGNNARKFFEIYLYYKFPDKGMTEDTLELFFGDERIPAVLTDRINNEYSHLAGIFERGSTPVEVPEMQTAAKLILQKIEERDRNQYSALLQSIGVTEEPAEEPQAAVEVQ